jgi:hypothetical protein
MEKTLINSQNGNLYELLIMGGGEGWRQFKLELWSKEKNKWINSGIYFKTLYELEIEKVIEIAKEKIESSIFE